MMSALARIVGALFEAWRSRLAVAVDIDDWKAGTCRSGVCSHRELVDGYETIAVGVQGLRIALKA